MSVRDKLKALLGRAESFLGTIILSQILERLLRREVLIDLADALLDYLEDLAARTETPIDDAIIRTIREALNIPDDDDDDQP